MCCAVLCRVFGGSSSFSIIESMQKVVLDIRIYLLYLLLMVSRSRRQQQQQQPSMAAGSNGRHRLCVLLAMLLR